MKRHFAASLILALSSIIFVGVALPEASAIGVIDLTISNVYWGTNPLSPVIAHPGEENVQLSIVLTNVGDASAWSIEATLFLKPPFSYNYVVDGKVYSVPSVSTSGGVLLPGQSATLRYTLSVDPTAKEGIHRLNLGLFYKTQTDVEVTVDRYVDVPVWSGDLRVQRVATSPTKIHPGDNQVNYKAWIINAGTAIAKNVEVKLQLKYPFKPSSSGSDRIFLGSLQPNQVSEADFYFDIDEYAAFGDYSLELFIKYGYSRSGTTSQVPLYMNEKARFLITAVEPNEAYAGDSGVNIRVTVRNTGNVTAESIRAQLRVGNYFSGTTTDYLGMLHFGEEKTAIFTLDIDGRIATGQYRIDLIFDWTQNDKSLNQKSSVMLRILPKPFPLLYVAIIGIIVMAIAWSRVRKKKAAIEFRRIILDKVARLRPKR